MDAALILDSSGHPDESIFFTQENSRSSALRSIAEMIVGNRLWRSIPGGVLVARETPYPLLAVFGGLSANHREILTHLGVQLRDTITRHRYIGYPDAERAVERLAAAMLSVFSREEIASFRFTAFPRGGLIVLGMLSYVLGLSREQIVGTSDDGPGTLVVVDDCALTGLRFREFMNTTRAERVVFCPVFAPAGLLSTIERAEPRIAACISGERLSDAEPRSDAEHEQPAAAPQPVADTRPAGDPPRPYRTVRAEYIAFAWSEPDTGLPNPETGRTERGWNVVPPRLCLDRRARAVADDAHLGFVTPPAGPIAPSDRVLWVESGDAIAVARFPDAAGRSEAEPAAVPCFKLEKSAAIMWRAIVETGDLRSAEAALAKVYDIDPAALRRDLTRFVDELRGAGLIGGASAL